MVIARLCFFGDQDDELELEMEKGLAVISARRGHCAVERTMA